MYPAKQNSKEKVKIMKKSTLKRIAALSVAGLMATTALAGCGESSSTTDGSSSKTDDAAKGSVYWLNFKPESDVALQDIAKMYKDKTGVDVKVVTAASGTYNDTLTSEMDKDGAPTLFVVGNQASVETWGEYCLDLKDTKIANELSTDDYKLYDADGKLCSIGYCYECYGIIANKELLTKAGYKAEDITNFAKLKEVAEDIHARSAELGFDAFTSSGMDDSSSWRFTGHLANVEYYYESVDSPDAWKTCPAEIKGTYMDNYKNLYDLMVTNSATDRAALATGGFDAAAEFKESKAVFYANGNWEWSGLSEAGMTAENLTMLPYYCGVEGEEKAGLNCGTENYWAVNAKASEEDQQATIDFMYWLVTDADASAKAVETFGVMPYKSAAKSSNPFLAQADAYAAAGNYTMPWVTNFQPNVDAYRATLVAAMNDYNANPSDDTWAKVKTAFVDGWATQYAAANE